MFKTSIYCQICQIFQIFASAAGSFIKDKIFTVIRDSLVFFPSDKKRSIRCPIKYFSILRIYKLLEVVAIMGKSFLQIFFIIKF